MYASLICGFVVYVAICALAAHLTMIFTKDTLRLQKRDDIVQTMGRTDYLVALFGNLLMLLSLLLFCSLYYYSEKRRLAEKKVLAGKAPASVHS